MKTPTLKFDLRSLPHRFWHSAVIWSFLNTALRVGMGVLVLPLILRRLPSEQLGLWYVFGTMASLASLLDFGFEPTITRMASYVWGGASKLIAFGIHKDEPQEESRKPNLALLNELVATLRTYYFWVGLGILILLEIGGGAWVWRLTNTLSNPSTLRAAWLVYAVGCCLNFISGRWPALLAGVGAVKQSQHLGVISLLAYYATAIVGLSLGWGIWAMVSGFIAMGFVSRTLGKKMFLYQAGLSAGMPAAQFHREIFAAVWPNAWRWGLVSVGSFLISQSNTLQCSARLDLATTASYGISLQLLAMLGGISSVWLSVKWPVINQLRVQHRTEEIISLFANRARLVILTYLAGAAGIIFLAPWAMHLIGSKTNLLPVGQLALLATTQFLETHHAMYAGLVLSENRNPFMKPALISGVAIVGLSYFLLPRYGIWGMLLSVGVVQASFNNWWTVYRGLRGLNLKPTQFFFHILFRSGR